MRRINIYRIFAISVVMTVLMLSGCSREETIAYFNHIEDEPADGISSTEYGTAGSAAATEYESTDDTSSTEHGSVDVINTAAEEIVDKSDGTEKPVDSLDLAADIYTGPTISLVMVGDILLHTPVAESGIQEDGSYNFDALFANVKDEITAADLALVNQEVIIGGEELGISGYPSFNAPYELGDALVAAGFDVVLHATNHALDQGKKGVKNCLSFWKNYHPEVAVLGIHESQKSQDDHIYVYEQEGIRIAILNYTYGTNGIALPADMPYAVDLLDEEKVTADIEKAKEQADFIIVCPHWGTEYQLTPSPEQERWTELFLENGVDLVIGTHPHVIEPIEWISNQNTAGQKNDVGTGNQDGMLVYYSLGNFVNWTAGSGEGIANRMVGGMAEVTIGMDACGEAFIVDYGVEPLVCHPKEGTNGVTTYLLSEYTEELASENAIITQDEAFSRGYCQALCEEVWDNMDWK